MNSCPNAVKWLYFALQFSKIFRGSMPPDPSRDVPPSAVALSVPEKNPTFSQNLNGSTDIYASFVTVRDITFLMPFFFADGFTGS